MRVLVLSNVWVEPTSSAAGSRMLQLLNFFLDQGWEVAYATTASLSAYGFDMETLGVQTHRVQMNDSGFDAFAKAYTPHIVLFDRFMVEEQFGWRIAENCPDALRLLDTEDLHCLRKARQLAIKQERDFSEAGLLSDIAKREIASIYRCDLTLMISQFEIDLLERFFKVPSGLLHYIPFLLEPLKADFKPYEERQHFISIGNFLHEPNWDAVQVLRKEIWPSIRKQLPKAELHVYGAYPSPKVEQLHNPKEGFLIKGRAENAHDVVASARVLLAPLRFGAGLKGKFIDAMQCGTPSVTTAIGTEGMSYDIPWSGVVEDDFYAFAKAATQLYTSKPHWEAAQQNGVAIINTNFQKSDFEPLLINQITALLENLLQHRSANFTGQMLMHHTAQGTKYMSKWIEEKNSKSQILKKE